MGYVFLIVFAAGSYAYGVWAGVGAVVLLLVIFYALGSVFESKDEEPDWQSRRRPKAPRPRAPEKFIAWWRVKYVDREGVLTERVIRVKTVRPRVGEFQVWCELRKDTRTLLFTGLQDIVDIQTGEVIDLPVWLDEYKAYRKSIAAGVRE